MQHPINQKQPLFMRWYEEYRERRYLVDASDEEVIQRSLHLTTNALSLTADGKIGMEAIETPQAAFIMRLYSHALEESRLRTGDYLGLFRNHGVRDFGPPHATVPAPPASPEILRISGEHPKYKWLFKFGKRQWFTTCLITANSAYLLLPLMTIHLLLQLLQTTSCHTTLPRRHLTMTSCFCIRTRCALPT